MELSIIFLISGAGLSLIGAFCSFLMKRKMAESPEWMKFWLVATGLPGIVLIAISNAFTGNSIIAVGLLITGLGAACNLVAVYFNNYLMPVEVKKLGEGMRLLLREIDSHPDQEEAINLVVFGKRHCALHSETRFKWLCDRFIFRNGVCSIGDFLIYLGGLVVITAWVLQIGLLIWSWLR